MWFALPMLVAMNGASAAEIAVIGIHDPALDLAAQEARVRELVAVVEAGGRHDGLLPAEVAARYAGREDLILQEAFLKEGRRRMEDGRLLYQQADADGAVDVLENAVRTLEENVRWSRSVRDLWEAWMLLGTARLASGNEAGGHDAIASALAIHPARRPDPATFPPDVIEAWESERDTAAGEAAKVLVAVDVPGSRVWIDGRDAGASPLTVSGMLPGRHFVHARTATGAVGFTVVEVAPGVDQPVRVATAAAVLGAPARGTGSRSAQIGALYEAVGRYTGVDLILMVGTIDGVPELQLFAPESDSFDKPVVLAATSSSADVSAALASLIERIPGDGSLPASDTAYTALPFDVSTNRVLARDLYAPTVVSPPVPTPATPDPVAPTLPVVEIERDPKLRWPVWLGIGLGTAAAAAGATALALVLTGPDAEPPSAGGTITIGPPLR